MLHGDISNREAPVIAFNADNLLFESRDDLSFFKKIFEKRKLNQVNIDIINNLWYNSDFSVYLVTKCEVDDFYELLESYGVDIQATKIVHYTGVPHLRRLVEYRFYLYVDSDDSEITSLVSNRKAVTISDFTKIYFPTAK